MILSSVSVLLTLFLQVSGQESDANNQTVDSATVPIKVNLTMCYFIERNTKGIIYDYNKAAPAMDLATIYANDFILPPGIQLRSVYTDIGSECNRKTHVIGQALKQREDGITCSVYIGPGCGLVAEIFNDLISVWDKPIIGCPASGVGLSAPSSEYTIISRTSITYKNIANVLLEFFDAYNYTTPAVLQDQSVNFFQQLGVLMQQSLLEKSEVIRYGSAFIPFYSADDKTPKLEQMLMKILAHGLGMTKGDYIFVAIELYDSDVWGPYTWSRSDHSDEVARSAFRSLALLGLTRVTTTSAIEFWRQVVKLAQDKYNFNFTDKQKENIDPVVSHFYDAVLLFANVVTTMIGQGLNYSSGLNFTLTVANYTFDSPATGKVTFNADSDRLLDYEMQFFNNFTDRHETILGFPAASQTVTILGKMSWFGQPTLPPNTPHCGFRGDSPHCNERGSLSSGATAGIAVAVVLILAGIAFCAFIGAKRLMYSNLDPFWWRILEQDMAINSKSGAKSIRSMASSVVSGMSEKKNESVAVTTTGPSSNGKTATIDNVIFSLLEFSEPKQRVPQNLPREALMLIGIQHNNVQKFVGIAVNDSNICDYMVGELCQKGSLQDLIEDTRMNLDWEFKNSLIKDLTSGLVYLHGSPIVSHGFLNDNTCQIDSRFIMKIGGYGFDCLRTHEELQAFHLSQLDRNTRPLLWRAPELLRRTMPPAGTPKGDIYSYAILLQQIILRTEPFQKGNHHNAGRETSVLNIPDIIHDVARGATPPLRPPVPMSACSAALHEIMDNCWAEEPVNRPTTIRLRAMVQNAIKKSGDNIVDHLIKRMETYSSELEAQVDKKTKEFMEERQRAAGILQEILPKVIAEALSKGHTVLPETYKSTTVYFSSIVGFKEYVMQARSPLETVTMLNNLYNVCDGVIGSLDVFKVEVVVDSYLVVSGLPVRNGDRHVEQIASMALQLRKEISSLMSSNREHAFKLRAGIHSGPCVAGVVGLKMPRYCLFGDTVNTASRMESHGEAGKIHCSDKTKSRLESFDEFVLVERGTMDIKGKGKMMTYWLVGKN
ncbi:Atrial natriuretic peptide receptor 1 [Hypsibius exemplaris]|uniref:Guanylate cyclase n=1 Tax=Hypsibius exemplaris TaxID=2072580 RepID=A0A9X6NAI9_HYPEX|nr:Atrial natriuretic peptide receptor 1 [Hypsibius exemplaris]